MKKLTNNKLIILSLLIIPAFLVGLSLSTIDNIIYYNFKIIIMILLTCLSGIGFAFLFMKNKLFKQKDIQKKYF